jgi:hypothetical protein
MAFISDLLTVTTGNTLDWCQRDPSAAVQKDFLSVKDFYRFDICVDPAVLNIYEKGILIQSFDTGLSELVTAVQAQDAAKKAAALAALDTLFT